MQFETKDYKFIITEELLTRETKLGEIVRDYIINIFFANNDEEIVNAVETLFASILNGIESDNEFRVEITNSLVKINENVA